MELEKYRTRDIPRLAKQHGASWDGNEAIKMIEFFLRWVKETIGKSTSDAGEISLYILDFHQSNGIIHLKKVTPPSETKMPFGFPLDYLRFLSQSKGYRGLSK